MQLAADADKDLIHVPSVARLRPPPTRPDREVAPEPQAPLADALVRDGGAPFGQDRLDIAWVRAEDVVQSHRVADDPGREAVTGVGGEVWLHPAGVVQPHNFDNGSSS